MKTNGAKILVLLAIVVGSIGLNAQTAAEALRYSRSNLGGTARTMGSGGAFGALGADFGSLLINPAGLATFRGSHLSISPSFNSNTTDANYYGELHSDATVGLAFNNLGLVLHNQKRNASNGWVSSTFGVGFNRMNDFNSNRFVSGFNPENSLTKRYAEQANGTYVSELTGSASDAFETYLIDPVGDLESADYEGRVNEGGVQQEEVSLTKGSQSELTFDFAGNYKDKLYLGASFNVPFISYESETSYRERDTNDLHDDFDELRVTDRLLSEGTGFNAKFGFIYRLNDRVRLGGAFHSPTYYSMSDEYSSELSSVAVGSNGSTEQFELPRVDGNFDYKLRTPYKLVASAAMVIPQFGFISVDYEYQDFSLARFDYESSDADVKAIEGQVNRQIKDNFRGVSTIRVGGEYALDAFRLRAGYSLQGRATRESVQSATQSITAGVGFVADNYTFDVGYVNTSREYDYELYQLTNGVEAATVDDRLSNFVLTLGFKF